MILDSTIFHPQGGGQPADTGVITDEDSGLRFIVEDVRSKDGTVMLLPSFFKSLTMSFLWIFESDVVE